MKKHGKIEHLGPDVLDEQLRSVMFKTGDPELDVLLEDARARFLSPDPKVRRDSIEKLWDAWERLKTLEVQGDKKTSIKQLLTKAILNVPLKEKIESECLELTKIGNQFRIRHHEMGKVEIQSDLDVDYLFYRLFGLIFRLLKGTGRVI